MLASSPMSGGSKGTAALALGEHFGRQCSSASKPQAAYKAGNLLLQCPSPKTKHHHEAATFPRKRKASIPSLNATIWTALHPPPQGGLQGQKNKHAEPAFLFDGILFNLVLTCMGHGENSLHLFGHSDLKVTILPQKNFKGKLQGETVELEFKRKCFVLDIQAWIKARDLLPRHECINWAGKILLSPITGAVHSHCAYLAI